MKIISTLALTAFILLSPLAKAQSPVPHVFKAGDLISADHLNENFSSLTPDLGKILIGSWAIQCWDSTIGSVSASAKGAVTITALNQISSAKVAPCLGKMSADGRNASTSIDEITPVGNSAFIVTYKDDKATTAIQTHPVLEASQFRLVIGTGQQGVALWERTDASPASPQNVTANVKDDTVRLSWTHSGQNVTGFQILRKNSLTEAYLVVAQVVAADRSFSDKPMSTVSWYRIVAINDHGESFGSVAVKVGVR